MRIGWAQRAAVGTTLATLACGARTELDVTPTCLEYVGRADLAPLDIVLALDTSNSMDDPVSDGRSKIVAVRDAVESFVVDPDSAGIGMTTIFFPVMRPEVPTECLSDADCGEPGMCRPLSACFPSLSRVCATADDCEVGDRCEPYGFCGGDPDEGCRLSNPSCLFDAPCVPGGSCGNTAHCESSQYAPTQPFRTLPDEAQFIAQTLRNIELDGSTPSLPALEGAIDAAAERMQQVPDRKAIVLLATDGFPTSCDLAIPAHAHNPSEGIPALVGVARAGLARGVETYVIGVFTREEADAAQQQLSDVSTAGGTGEAIVIDGDDDGRLLESLNLVRGEGSCAYTLPLAVTESERASRLVVTLARPSGPQLTIPRVTDCVGHGAGFVFDQEPTQDQHPIRIELCPEACRVVTPTTEVHLSIDCAESN